MMNNLSIETMNISKELVRDLFIFLKEKNYIPMDFNLVCFQSEDEEFGLDYSKDFNGCFKLDQLVLPYTLEIEEDGEEYLREVIKSNYNFDIFNHFKNLSNCLNDIVFSIMHEMGHLHQYLNNTKEEFLRSCQNYTVQLKAVNLYSKFMNDRELEYQYRKIHQEKYADTFAIGVLKQYKNELEELLKKYDNNEEIEIEMFGEFFEI